MLDLPLSRVPLIFLDTETTGLSPRFGDRVVEIALARFRGGVMENYFDSLVNPGRRIPPDVSRIHGITDAQVRDAPTFAELARQLLTELSGAVIVAHNAPFDLGFVHNEFSLAGRERPDNLVVDTLTLLRAHFTFRSNSLPRIAQDLGIPNKNAHRALNDALTTHEVFTYILRELGPRAATLGDLLSLQGGTIEWRQRNGEDLPVPPVLEKAMRSNRRVFLRYVDGNGELSERWVSPRTVFMQQEIIYLRAFCYLRNEERQFRLDRVREMKVE